MVVNVTLTSWEIILIPYLFSIVNWLFSPPKKTGMQKISLAIHGGAGTILKELMTPELEKEYQRALGDALKAGYILLEKGSSAVDAVKAAVMVLEDNIMFNAGRGSVFTNKGSHEMDAAIMDGKDLSAGAVAGVKNIKNPVELA